MQPAFTEHDVTALILAGGKGRRLNGINKGLIEVNQLPMIAHVINRVKDHCDNIIISANADIEGYQSLGYEVITDQIDDFQGPLSGIISTLPFVKTSLIMTIPCDTPLIPQGLISRCLDCYNQEEFDLCVVDDGDRLQNLFMLFNITKKDSLETFFSEGNRAVNHWIKSMSYGKVDFAAEKDQFHNVNTPEQLAILQHTLKT